MPVNIIRVGKSESENVSVAWLCDETWEMPPQIEALERWLIEESGELEKGSYVADIGFSPRAGACGGGAALSLESMKAMLEANMVLFLSEYPPTEEGEDEESQT